MAIDIRNVNAGKVSSNPTSANRVKNKQAKGASNSTTSDDSVELTGKASQIGSLIEQMLAQPVVDNSRVVPVKEKLDSGRYEIDDEHVAQKMLEFEAGYSRSR